MSEATNESVDSKHHSKDCNSKEESAQECTRDKHQSDFRNHRRSFNDCRRNRGSHSTAYRNDRFGRKAAKRNWSNIQQDGKRKKLVVGSRLKETDVGITEFMGDDRFFGIIKERFTDFHVNEIGLDGQVARLTNQDIPLDEEDNTSLEDLKNTVSDTIWDQLQGLKESSASTVEIDVTNIDKDQRRAIHAIAKKMTNIMSQTVDKENKKIMMILPQKKDGRSSHSFRKDNRVDWKKRGGEYCHFLLHKVNMDTMDTLNQLAMYLRVKPNNFNYAGTKDRRAWTTQWVSLRRAEPCDILRAAKSVRGAFVGNFKFEKEPLKLGMLMGNHFRIALRNATGTDEQIEKTMIALRDHGFINYYGLQRFGTVAAIPTHEIGKALLQGKWNEAVELILKPREGEQDRDLIEARKIYEATKDASAAYRQIKRCDKIEAALLRGLCVSGTNNPQGALDSIPRNARLMYIHAYQSYVWNLMVSRRIKEFGKKPIVGDLVYEDNVKEHESEDEFAYDNECQLETPDNMEPSADADLNTEEAAAMETEANTLIHEVTDATQCCLKIHENTQGSNATNEKDEAESLLNFPTVKILKEEDLPNYTLSDVLMPQVGWRVTYPPYAKPWFDDFLGKDGLTTDLRQKNKKYSLGGTYRKILEVPENLSWKIVHYREKHSDLILSDIDEMRKSTSPKDDPEGQYKALIVEMSLKSCTYATMALREMLKFDTSSQTQAAQFAACNLDPKSADSSKDCANDAKDVQSDNNSTEEDKMEVSVQM